VLDKEMEEEEAVVVVVVVVAAAVAVEENIMLQMACKLRLVRTFLMFYVELKDCTVETKVPSLVETKVPSLKIPPPPLNYLL
jgi:hypothetical protein